MWPLVITMLQGGKANTLLLHQKMITLISLFYYNYSNSK
jgi:hypothetical protein